MAGQDERKRGSVEDRNVTQGKVLGYQDGEAAARMVVRERWKEGNVGWTTRATSPIQKEMFVN